MPTSQIHVHGQSGAVPLVYLFKHPNLGPSKHLHLVRSPIASPDAEELYELRKLGLVNDLARQVAGAGYPFDAIVSPPSSRADSQPYREALAFGVTDLTSRFSRRGKVRAMRNKPSFNDVVGEFDYQAAGDEHGIKSLLVVDDIVASGITIAAVLEKLRNAGLSPACEVYAAAPI